MGKSHGVEVRSPPFAIQTEAKLQVQMKMRKKRVGKGDDGVLVLREIRKSEVQKHQTGITHTSTNVSMHNNLGSQESTTKGRKCRLKKK